MSYGYGSSQGGAYPQQASGQGGSYPQHYGGPPPNHPNAPPPPMLPPPWHAEWNPREGHYDFVNQQTGERTRQVPVHTGPPQQGYGQAPPHNYGGPPPQQGYGGPPHQQGYGGPPPQQGYGQAPQHPIKQGHNYKDMAIGGAGGALLGGFLTHEWDEHKEHRKEDEFRREERHQEDEIERLRRENAEERRENQGLQNEVYRDESRPMYGGGEYGRVEDRREYDNGYRQQNTEYIQRDDTFVENTYVDERRDDVYEQRDTFVERDDEYSRRDEYVQDDYGRRDDYRDDSLVDDAARWAGREEQRVDDIPYDIEQKFDRVEDAFEGGRDEQRYDDERY